MITIHIKVGAVRLFTKELRIRKLVVANPTKIFEKSPHTTSQEEKEKEEKKIDSASL